MVVLIALCVFFSHFEAAGSPASDAETIPSLKRTIESLSSLGSRIPGYEGNIKAADYVFKAFEQIGLKELRKEEFSVTVPIDKGASLEMPGGERIKLYCIWPNIVRTSTLPREGVRGKLIYAGKGEYRDYNGCEIEGSIVALDFNSGNNWLKAAELGAKAIIFIEPEETVRIEAEKKFAKEPINVPPFHAPS